MCIILLLIFLGIFVGCYMVEAVLQSDLRCFFDSVCLKTLISKLDLPSLNNITYNDSLLLDSTRYFHRSSIYEILSNLMIENWNNQSSYENYINQCSIEQCAITFIKRGSFLYIITTTLGLIGGLTTVYRFIIPLIIHYSRKILNRQRINIITVSSNNT